MSASTVAQQSVHVRLLDGETGKAITNARVTIITYRDYRIGQSQAIEAGDQYAVPLHGEESIGLGNISRSQSAWNEFELCTSRDNLKPIFSVSEILSKGVVVPNECSKRIGAAPAQGEAVFFVRHLSIWERIRAYHFPS